MGDPIKDDVKDVQPEPVAPLSPAEIENKALRNLQFENFKAAKMGQPTSVLPFGVRIDATKYVKARYTSQDEAHTILGAPEKIVKESFRREHPGWKYAWPVATGLKTRAYIGGGRYHPVPFEAVDESSGLAMVTKSPEGHALWLSHMLVAVPPDVWEREYVGPVETAIGQTAMNRDTIESQLQSELGKAGYRPEYSVSDIKQER